MHGGSVLVEINGHALLGPIVLLRCTDDSCKCSREIVHRGIYRREGGDPVVNIGALTGEDCCPKCGHPLLIHFIPSTGQPDPEAFTKADRQLLQEMGIAPAAVPPWFVLYQPPEVGEGAV
jgi:hypothetical protein